MYGMSQKKSVKFIIWRKHIHGFLLVNILTLLTSKYMHHL